LEEAAAQGDKQRDERDECDRRMTVLREREREERTREER
jgi:hypothetical protein